MCGQVVHPVCVGGGSPVCVCGRFTSLCGRVVHPVCIIVLCVGGWYTFILYFSNSTAFVAFLIGFFVLILSAFVFFAGGISTKFCDDLAPPNYILFAEVGNYNNNNNSNNNIGDYNFIFSFLCTQTIDNPAITGGDYFLSRNLFSNGSIPLTVSGILLNCSDNSTVYQALKLENLDFIREIQNFSNITEVREWEGRGGQGRAGEGRRKGEISTKG